MKKHLATLLNKVKGEIYFLRDSFSAFFQLLSAAFNSLNIAAAVDAVSRGKVRLRHENLFLRDIRRKQCRNLFPGKLSKVRRMSAKPAI